MRAFSGTEFLYESQITAFGIHSYLFWCFFDRAVRSQPVYCADVYRERGHQMLCEYNFSSWRWAC